MTTFIPALTLPRAVFDHPASSILLPVALGTAVGYSATKTRQTYERIKNPPFNPPPQVFGPVWTILYGLMGYAAWRSVRIGLSPGATAAQADLTRHGAMIYTIQLGLNFAWTPLFFVLNRPVLAVADIATLLGLNSYLAYTWGQVDRTTGLLQIPYLCWLSFATYLCAGAGYLNGWDLSDKPKSAPKGKAL